MNLTDSARKVLEKRYLLKDDEGNPIEQPEDMFRRVSHAVAQAEKNYVVRYDSVLISEEDPTDRIEEEFYEMLTNLEFMPNSPTLFNAGKPTGTLSGCFAFNIDDTMESILDVNTKIGMVEKHGGGVGICLSDIRPKGFHIASTHGKACGPIAVMKMIHATNDMITQGGARAGAMMAILRCDHPDIFEFVNCKMDNHVLNGFNISVVVTNAFMEAVEYDGYWNLVWDDIIVKKIKARDLWNKIISNAWKNGDPGLLFDDEMQKHNPTPWFGNLIVNPCGEQTLLSDESCNLGSINLGKFVIGKLDLRDNKIKNIEIDWNKLEKVICLAVRFLDDVIDVNKFPIKIIEENTKRTRKIGLGVMGWADMLVKLQIPYNSEEAVELAEHVMKFIDDVAYAYSVKLGRERGSFPAYQNFTDREIFGVGGNAVSKDDIRNATRTTIAPTGSISLIAGASSGIEPIFALVEKRSNMSGALEGMELHSIYPLFEEILYDAIGKNINKEDYIRVIDELYHGRNLNDVLKGVVDNKFFDIFVTSHEVSLDWHIRMQAAFQKYVNNAVSKTINLPNSANIEDINEVYFSAWRHKLKGITIYRDGSREEQVLEVVTRKQPSENVKQVHPYKNHNVRPRARSLSGYTDRLSTGCGYIYVTVNYDDNDDIREVLVTLGKSGGCVESHLQGLARLVSLALKYNIPIEQIFRQIRNIRCPRQSMDKGTRILSCPDAIAKILMDHAGKTGVYINFDDKDHLKYQTPMDDIKDRNTEGVCPECKEILVREEGCLKCHTPGCGFSQC